jgi:hypothetical protein
METFMCTQIITFHLAGQGVGCSATARHKIYSMRHSRNVRSLNADDIERSVSYLRYTNLRVSPEGPYRRTACQQ